MQAHPITIHPWQQRTPRYLLPAPEGSAIMAPLLQLHTNRNICDRPETPTPENDRPLPPEPSGPQPSVLATIREVFEVLALAVLMVMLIRNFVQNYRIDGISMEPNFHDQQFLIVNRWAYCPGIHLEVPMLNVTLWEKTWCVRQPQRGDVVVFEYPRDPSRDFIKRVIGLPGETVEVRRPGVHQRPVDA